MSVPAWSYILHFSVPPISAAPEDEVSVEYDSSTDTLFARLRPLRGPIVNCWAGRYTYLCIEWASREPVGVQVDDFVLAAADHDPRLLQIAVFGAELFKPMKPARPLLDSELRLRVVHQSVVMATRAYDRHHGLRAPQMSSARWLERESRMSEEHASYAVDIKAYGAGHRSAPEPVAEDFRRFLTMIGQRRSLERRREFDRVVQYWSGQPSGQIKRATGEVLLTFFREHQSASDSSWSVDPLKEEYLLRTLRAG